MYWSSKIISLNNFLISSQRNLILIIFIMNLLEKLKKSSMRLIKLSLEDNIELTFIFILLFVFNINIYVNINFIININYIFNMNFFKN